MLAQPVVGAISTTPATPVQAGQAISFTADASVANGDPLEYRWDFGDGSPRTDWLAAPEAGHAYARPGVYTVLLQVRHPAQGLAARTAALVVRLPSGLPARHSGTVLVHPARREVWSVNPDHGSVAVVDADTLSLLEEIDVGTEPVSLAVDGSGRVWVALRADDRLVRVDPGTRMVDAAIELGHGAQPAAVVIAADGATGFAALAAGAVQRFSAPVASADLRLSLAPHADALAVSGDGSSLYVGRLVSGQDQGTVWRIALPAFDQAEAIALPLDADSPDSGTAGRGVPNYVGALALAEDGATLWYGAKKDNVLRGVHREGQPLSFETVLRSLLGRIDAGAGAEDPGARMDLDNAGRISALLSAPGASHLFAAQETNNRVLVLDPWNRRELARLEVGRAPRGLAYDPLARRLFVQAFLSRRLDVFDLGAALDDGVSPAVALGSAPTSSSEPLDPLVLEGKRVFYNAADPRMTQDGYLACASCHLDGRGDGRVWDFTQLGEGLRNTTSLLGSAGMARGLLHWSGNFDEVQDFEVPIRGLFGGLGFMDDAAFASHGPPLGAPKQGLVPELDALAAYLASLDRDDRSPFRDVDGSLPPEAVAGRGLFLALGCQACHAGPSFTDSASGMRHDVGTLQPGSGTRLAAPLLALDTPTLRGLAGTAPYLHDGSAATLEDVLVARNPEGGHGGTEALDAGERAQLVAFLRAIDATEPGAGGGFALALASPVADATFGPGQSVPFAIATDLAGLDAVDFLVDGEVVATAHAPPWTADWPADRAGAVALHARVHHAGRHRTLSPQVGIRLLGPGIFGNGFEAGAPTR